SPEPTSRTHPPLHFLPVAPNQAPIPAAAVADPLATASTLCPGPGGGQFHPFPTPPPGRGPTSLAAADFNLNGYPDLVVGHADSGELLLLPDPGLGGSDPRWIDGFPGAPGPAVLTALQAADFNGDGIPDLALTHPAARPRSAP